MKDERLARAISASHRRDILRLLIKENLTVKEIASRLGISDSLCCKHLKLLYDLEIVKVEVKSPFKYYSIKAEGIKELISMFDKVVKRL